MKRLALIVLLGLCPASALTAAGPKPAESTSAKPKPAAVPSPATTPAPQSVYRWKAGVAALQITPRQPMRMAGYAGRKKPSEGVALDLFAKALAIEDAAANRVVFVTADIIGFSRTMRDEIVRLAAEKHSLPPAALCLIASHTHCGPELRLASITRDGAAPESVQVAEAYAAELRDKLLGLVGQAIANLAPAQLDYLHARAGFAMNRRQPTEAGYRNSPYSDGPVDHDVPVLRVADAAGKLRAVLFGYACHNTTLGYYKFSGDYAGYAQKYLQEAHPEAVALFATGCGADQNPYPRSTEELAEQHGRALANAVEAALLTRPRPLAGPLCVRLKEVSLDFAPPPPRAELEKIAASKKVPDSGHARRLLDELEKNGKLRTHYPYLVQTVRFGDGMVLVALAGEVVVDYSLRLKRELAGPAVWVCGYSNEVFARLLPFSRGDGRFCYEKGSGLVGIMGCRQTIQTVRARKLPCAVYQKRFGRSRRDSPRRLRVPRGHDLSCCCVRRFSRWGDAP